MLGFGRAAREVCALALRRGVCFHHLVSVNYESDTRLYFFATQKALGGARTHVSFCFWFTTTMTTTATTTVPVPATVPALAVPDVM